MSYLASGTNYPNAPTYYLPGIAQDGADYVATVVATTGSTGPLVGASGSMTLTALTSKIFWEVGNSNGATGSTVLLNAVASGQSLNGTEASKTPSIVKIYDVNGNWNTCNLTVSGSSSAVTINGSAAKVYNTAYGVATLTNVTGNTWIAQ